MGRNVYFSQSVTSEQDVYEDLIIESLKIYGQDIYYLPRDIVERDDILGEDRASKYDDAYMLEGYLENVDGFEGTGDLFQKFGIEIRDEVNFVLSRRVFEQTIGVFEEIDKPNEGDIIYLPLSNSYFEITYVDSKKPFYQLSNLPVYRLTCALYEFNDEEFSTGIDEIDDVVKNWSYTINMRIEDSDISGAFEVGEVISQAIPASPGVSVYGTLQAIDASNSGYQIFTLSNIGTSGSTDVKEFILTAGIAGSDSGATATAINTIYDIDDTSPDDQNVFANDAQAKNVAFEIEADNFLDFSESNPFGEPGN